MGFCVLGMFGTLLILTLIAETLVDSELKA